MSFGQLPEKNIHEIHENALNLLESTGVLFNDPEAVEILTSHGASADGSIIRFPRNMVEEAAKKVPSEFDLYGADGNALRIGGNETHFAAGSCGIRIRGKEGAIKQSVGVDLRDIVRLTDGLDNIALASSSVVPHEIPEAIGDSYRVAQLLQNTRKPFVTGAFSAQGLFDIYELLEAACGGKDALARKPRAVLDVCSLSPLKWTDVSCRNLIDGARLNLPLELISAPLIGATAPMTLYGCVLMHTVEILSGIVLIQCVNPGNRVVYGGAPMYFDMRRSTTSLNSVETSLVGAAYAQMGRFYGLPTHIYACLSDAKSNDAQAGLESGISALMAAQSGFNIISGAGMLEFCNTFSLEKLVIDNEIIGMVKRLAKGVSCGEEEMAAGLIGEMGPGSDYLSTGHTFKWFRKEPYLPSDVIDRKNLELWQSEGCRTAEQKASDIVSKKLAQVNGKPQEIKDAAEAVWEKIRMREGS
ncbi:MAG: trimethylamine methyltransferase family protein [Defluviitaleaceae bacterium]|nr:trimethylamine methyltransferase family protein [Defluviitaleaceae bacterium]MCL2835755.1 trimethylamine methyltransferase family protein [Defluviitaleaceae bacterium]